jgi:hypothetical protein
MTRIRWALAVALVGLMLSACQLRDTKSPTITVESLQVRTGTALRVLGINWRPGARVIIGLTAAGSQPRESETLTTALADASGSFLALFSIPTDDHWNQMTQIQVVAYTGDFDTVAVALFAQTPLVTATPVVLVTPTATGVPSAAYVLGYVENVVISAGTIKVTPVEGRAAAIAVVAETQILRQGESAQLSDIRVGDLIEASGQAVEGQEDRIIAEIVRILTQVTIEPTAAPTATLSPLFWSAEYYSNTTFSGNPVLTREDAVIDFQWQGSAPFESLPADNFAVRWTGTWPFEEGAYRFQAQVDDGVRLWLDEHLIIDHWHQSTGALYSADAYLSAGSHRIRVEYFDAQGNAHVRVWWDYRGLGAQQVYPDWKGEYYGDIALEGPPFLIVNERSLDFDWGDGVPASGMPADQFSIRWTASVGLEEGSYRFYARSDDGVRLWVDEVAVIDEWRDSGATTYSGETHLISGQHTVRVEYYENTGQAVIRVWWELVPATPTPTQEPIPTATLTPTVLPTTGPTETTTVTPELATMTPEPTTQATSVSPLDSPFLVYMPRVRQPMRLPGGLQSALGGRVGGPTAG